MVHGEDHAALDLELDRAAGAVALPGAGRGIAHPAVAGGRLERIGLVEPHVLEAVAQERSRQRLHGRQRVLRRQAPERIVEHRRDERRAQGMTLVVGMHLVGLHILPFPAARRDLRPQGIPEADHRQTVVPADIAVPFLGVRALVVHGEERTGARASRLHGSQGALDGIGIHSAPERMGRKGPVGPSMR